MSTSACFCSSRLSRYYHHVRVQDELNHNFLPSILLIHELCYEMLFFSKPSCPGQTSNRVFATIQWPHGRRGLFASCFCSAVLLRQCKVCLIMASGLHNSSPLIITAVVESFMFGLTYTARWVDHLFWSRALMLPRLASSKAMWATISKLFKVRNTGVLKIPLWISRKNWNNIFRNFQCRLKWHFPKCPEKKSNPRRSVIPNLFEIFRQEFWFYLILLPEFLQFLDE